MKISDFKIGDKLTINDKFYRSRKVLWELTVTSINTQVGQMSFTDEFGFDHTLTQAGLDFYGRNVSVIFKAEPLQLVSSLTETQILANALLGGEKEFTKTYKSIHGESDKTFRAACKAEDEFEHNKTIRFENGVLRFTSRYSGKNRVVTEFGCDAASCDCAGKESYHRELYNLCASSVQQQQIAA